MTADPYASRRGPLPGAMAVGLPGTVALRDVAWPTLIELRLASPQDGSSAITEAVESALGLDLPSAGRTSHGGNRLAVWLGPGWWLLDAPQADGPAPGALEASLVHRLRGLGGWVSAVEVSAGFAVLELAGPRAPDVLAHGCSIDLHSRVFGPGRAARTMLAKAQVVLAQTDGDATGRAPAYRIWVRTSFARYLTEWLLDAATEYLVDERPGSG